MRSGPKSHDGGPAGGGGGAPVDRTGPYGRQPHRFAVDEARYRAADHSWLADLDGLSVHAGDPQQRMATRAVAEAEWLVVDGHHPYEQALRRRILAQARPEVSAAVAGSEAACAEAAALVAHWLGVHHPGLTLAAADPTPPGAGSALPADPPALPVDPRAVVADPPALPADPWAVVAQPPAEEAEPPGPERTDGTGGLTPLERAALSVQEDLCVMERSPEDGGWRLTAGVVCFPSYWRLGEKVGHRQETIHGPVPHYEADLAPTVSRFFDRLRPGRIVSRRNWGFAAHPLLFVPQIAVLDTSDRHLPQDLWLRSERQTLRALPGTGAIVFTIKIQLAPAAALVHHPDLAGRLAQAITGWSPPMLAMRGSRYGGVSSITAWLQAVADRSWTGPPTN